jgi:hypothetical protein
MQATGLAGDGSAVQTVQGYDWTGDAEVLGLPGAGSPLLGPGIWAMLGEPGMRERQRIARKLEADAEEKGEQSEEAGESSGDTKERLQAVDRRLRRFLPSGAILKAELDAEHWLNYGAGESVAVIVGRRDNLLAKDPVLTAGRFASPEELHLGGLLWPEAAGRIAQTAFLTRERRNHGQIILFASDPNFRGYFRGTQRLFLNAVILGPGLGTRQRIPW